MLERSGTVKNKGYPEKVVTLKKDQRSTDEAVKMLTNANYKPDKSDPEKEAQAGGQIQ